MPPARSLRTGLLPAVHGVCWTWIVRKSAGYVETDREARADCRSGLACLGSCQVAGKSKGCRWASRRCGRRPQPDRLATSNHRGRLAGNVGPAGAALGLARVGSIVAVPGHPSERLEPRPERGQLRLVLTAALSCFSSANLQY